MKKSLIYSLAGIALLSSCDLDINENPNFPTSGTVTADLVFPAAENFIADCVGDQMFNYAGFFAQYWDQLPTANQYNDLAELNINESKDLFNRCYALLYSGALMDIEDVKSKTTNTADLFACAVLRAYAFQLVVDNLGYAPYTEALKGVSNPMPAWEKGVDVYNGVLAELDDAEDALSDNFMTVTDPMLDKDIDQWIGFANALRLRMLYRLVDGGVDVEANKQKIIALVQEGKFFTDNIKWNVYSDGENQYNPWYAAYKALTKNHCAAYPIISYYTATNDPRIDYVFNPRSLDNKFFGQMPGAKTVEFEWIGIATAQYQENYVSGIDYSVAVAQPVYLYTQAELQFLIAEAQVRFLSDDAAAQAAYETAIKADFIDRGIEFPGLYNDYLAGTLVAWEGTDAEKLDRIYRQKWAALFFRDHMEAWTEARRTDVPACSAHTAAEIYKNADIYTPGDFIVPAVNYSAGQGLCYSLPFPSSARNLNKNTPAAHTISDRVFWDVK
ncbi:MAG: SusD/RagB family nutrient-binding outer membrane lipoprotein [Bacteroidales bacterium]|nr:SusD/RagB family nutrient-binding outer membrane lipoprotein [Bacteroidales bacterium]